MITNLRERPEGTLGIGVEKLGADRGSDCSGRAESIILTSRVVERRFSGLPALPAVALVERQALLSRPRHYFKVACRILGLPEVPHSVHPAAAGVRHVEDLTDRVHGQIILVRRAGT